MFFGGDPFEHFAGMHGGGPGGGGGSRRGGGGGRQAQDVDTTKLYETLGVSYHLSSVCVSSSSSPSWKGGGGDVVVVVVVVHSEVVVSSLNPTWLHPPLSLSLSRAHPRNTSILAFESGGVKNISSSLHNDFRFRRAPTRRRSRRHTASSPCSTTPTVSIYHSYCL